MIHSHNYDPFGFTLFQWMIFVNLLKQMSESKRRKKNEKSLEIHLLHPISTHIRNAYHEIKLVN